MIIGALLALSACVMSDIELSPTPMATASIVPSVTPSPAPTAWVIVRSHPQMFGSADYAEFDCWRRYYYAVASEHGVMLFWDDAGYKKCLGQ